jgi:putative flippase GtrA
LNLTIKYTLVSLLATAADFTVFKLLAMVKLNFEAFGTLIGMVVGATISWTLHRYWVFETSTASETHKRSSYLLGQLLCIGLNVALMALVADYLQFARMPSRVFTSIAVWVVLYFFNRKVVFKI